MGNKRDQIIIYKGSDGLSELAVHLENETVWLNIDQMAELFNRNKSTISRHIKIYLKKESCKENQLLQILQQLQQMAKFRVV